MILCAFTSHFLRPFVIALTVFGMSLFVCAQQSSDAWHTFRAKGGVFSIDFPGEPQTTEENYSIIGTDVPAHLMKLELVSGHSFVAAYMDIALGGGTSELALDSAADGFIRSYFPKVGQVSARSSITQSGCKGREVRFDYASGGFVKSRFFESDKRFFMTIYESNRFAKSADGIAARFLDSFVITNGCQPGVKPEEAATNYPTRLIQGIVDSDTGWYRFSRSDDRFSVLMPRNQISLDTSVAGKNQFAIRLTRNTYLLDNQNSVYLVSVLGDFPSSMIEKPSDYELQLDTGARQLSNELKPDEFKLIRRLQVGDYPGREYRLVLGTRVGLVQTFTTGAKYYIFMATADRANATQPNFETFFSSIRLILNEPTPSKQRSPDQLSPASDPITVEENGGIVSGKITFNGIPPRRRRVDISDDPVCERINPNLMTEEWVIKNGTVADAFIYIKDGEVADGRRMRDLKFRVPVTGIILDQKGCHYVPRVTGIQAGQTLKVVNSDPTVHNVQSVPIRNKGWNQRQAKGGAPIENIFTENEIMIPIKDERHPWMKAYVGVLSHPYYAVSATDGSYEIRGVPPGTYIIAAWHEGYGMGAEKTLQVKVPANGKITANFSFGPSDVNKGIPLFPETTPDIEFKKGEWRFVDAAEGDLLYVNLATITTTPQGTFTVWFKNVPSDSPDGQASRQTSLDLLNALGVDRATSFSYSLAHTEFDCRNRKIRDLLATRYYDAQGNILYSDNADNYSDEDRAKFTRWESVLKSSVGEEQLNLVCRRR